MVSKSGFQGTFLVCLLISSSACAAEINAAGLTISVRDTSGAPVPNAVISIDSEGSESVSRRTRVIDQQERQFRPWVTGASTGDEVVIRNSDEITHHVYSFSAVKRFSFRLQENEEHDAITLDKPGVIVMGCNIHDWMVGYIHVSDGGYSSTTNEDGLVRFGDLPGGTLHIELWHPGLDESLLPVRRTIEWEAAGNRKLAFELPSDLRESGPREPPDDPTY